MDFLKYGLENKKSKSKLRRFIAECLLEIERRRADWYEARLDRKQLSIPDIPEETDAMLQTIWTRIREFDSGQSDPECSAQNCDTRRKK